MVLLEIPVCHDWGGGGGYATGRSDSTGDSEGLGQNAGGDHTCGPACEEERTTGMRKEQGKNKMGPSPGLETDGGSSGEAKQGNE